MTRCIVPQALAMSTEKARNHPYCYIGTNPFVVVERIKTLESCPTKCFMPYSKAAKTKPWVGSSWPFGLVLLGSAQSCRRRFPVKNSERMRRRAWVLLPIPIRADATTGPTSRQNRRPRIAKRR